MTDADKLKEAEDWVNVTLYGRHCNVTTHPAPTESQILCLWKRLVIEHPHLPREINAIDREIAKALRKS